MNESVEEAPVPERKEGLLGLTVTPKSSTDTVNWTDREADPLVPVTMIV